jgi:hypothetical protein
MVWIFVVAWKVLKGACTRDSEKPASRARKTDFSVSYMDFRSVLLCGLMPGLSEPLSYIEIVT